VNCLSDRASFTAQPVAVDYEGEDCAAGGKMDAH
jgi:hypothetical protein